MNKNGHLSIAEPCHENWQNMSQQEQGRHCDKCCKVVVDFTSMPTEKVIAFINERQTEKICGRFRSEQISEGKRSSSFVPRPLSLVPSPVTVFSWQPCISFSAASYLLPANMKRIRWER